ncbi:zona pellucida protein C [Misgurnus anguillicaudatus]|uniref:zona pellucida protein C n=1 Tax=Misgurnus anguillicaudatus TaxID=75329 RepID=UPI003CCF0429
MGVTAVFVVVCCTIASVASNGNDFNELVSSYSPLQDVRHVSDIPVITEDGYFLNEFLQPPTSDQFTSLFPMPFEVRSLLERSTSFGIRLMSSSWNDLESTNVFFKGDLLYVQVSASPGFGQQLYVQSCYASSSPNPSEKPEVAFIINRGCVASKKSSVKFVYRQSDRVNMVLGTSSLKSLQVYLHCRVSLSNMGLSSNTKFCNYNAFKSRWVDLSGQIAVCQCCERSCRSQSGREDLLALTAIVSTGPLTIKEKLSDLEAAPLTWSDYSTFKSKPAASTLSDKRWIMAGASFSGNSKQNMADTPHWPVYPGFGGGVMLISQGLGGALSMWLPDLMELQFNPMLEVGNGFSKNPAVVGVNLQGDDPFRVQKKPESFKDWQMKLDPSEKTLQEMVDVGEGKVNFEAVDPYDGAEDLDMWNLEDDNGLYKESFVTGMDEQEQPELDKPSQISDLPPDDFSPLLGTTPSPDMPTNGVEDDGEVFVRQAEMVFKKDEDEPVHYSQLSLNQAPDGSSSLRYEEQKRSSMKKQGIKSPKQELEKNVEKREETQKAEKLYTIKDLVSSLLDVLRGLWH